MIYRFLLQEYKWDNFKAFRVYRVYLELSNGGCVQLVSGLPMVYPTNVSLRTQT